MSYTTWVQNNNRFNVVLFEMWPCRQLYNWTIDNGGVAPPIYVTSFPDAGENLELDYLTVNGVQFTKAASYAALADLKFYQDRTTNEVFIRTFDDPTDAANEVKGFYFLGFSTKPSSAVRLISFNDKAYLPYIADNFDLVVHGMIPDPFDGFQEQPKIKINILRERLHDDSRYFDTLLYRDNFIDIDCRILHGDDGTVLDYADFRYWNFKTKNKPAISTLQVEFSLDPNSIFNQIFPKRVYTKELYPDIDDKYVGKAIPIGRGSHFYVPCACIDTTIGKYKIFDNANGIDTLVRVIIKDQEDITRNHPSFTADLPNSEFTLAASALLPTIDVAFDLEDGGSFAAATVRHFKATALDVNGHESLPTANTSITLAAGMNTFVIQMDRLKGAFKYRVYYGTSSSNHDRFLEVNEDGRAVFHNIDNLELGVPPTTNRFSPDLVAITYDLSDAMLMNESIATGSKDILIYDLGVDPSLIHDASFEETHYYYIDQVKIYLDVQKPMYEWLRTFEQSVPISHFRIDEDGLIRFEAIKPSVAAVVDVQRHDILELETITEELIPIETVNVGWISDTHTHQISTEWYRDKNYDIISSSSPDATDFTRKELQTVNTWFAEERTARRTVERYALLGAALPDRYRLICNSKLIPLHEGQIISVTYPEGWITSDNELVGDIFLIRDIKYSLRGTVPVTIEIDNYFGLGHMLAYVQEAGVDWDNADEHERIRGGFVSEEVAEGIFLADPADFSSRNKGTIVW